MGRIAVTEDVEGLRAEINISEDGLDKFSPGDDVVMEDAPKAEEIEENEEKGEEEEEDAVSPPPAPGHKGKCIATLIEVQDAFDAINTLRYSQPIHLQGAFLSVSYIDCDGSLNDDTRQMPGSYHHSVQRWTHSGWYNMEDPLSVLRDNPLRCEHQPHEGTPSRRDGPHEPPRKHHLRLSRPPRRPYHRR